MQQSEFNKIREELLTLRPPLVWQGFPRFLGTGGATSTDPREVRTGRGYVKELDFIPIGGDYITLFDQFFSVTAGGILLLENEPFTPYSATSQLGKNKHFLTQAEIGEGQTVELSVSISAALPFGGGQLQLFYTNPTYEKYLRLFDWGRKMSYKRITFPLTIGAGVTTDQIIRTIPKDRGNVIAFSISAVAEDAPAGALGATSLQNYGVTFAIEDVTIVDNVIGTSFDRYNGRDTYILPFPMQGGNEFTFSASTFAAAPAAPVDQQYYITFYFDN